LSAWSRKEVGWVKRDPVTLITSRIPRRDLLSTGGALAAGLAGAGLFGLGPAARAQVTTGLSMQIGWLANAQMAGDFVAIDKGYFREAGVDLIIRPGGPGIDPIQPVAGGSTQLGNAASIGVLVNARARGLPLVAFGTALQRHPFAFLFFTQSGIRTPKDFEGKTIGTQPTARVLVDAVLRKYQVPKERVKILSVGGDISPLVTHQVDIYTGWLIDRIPLLENLGLAGSVGSFRLWDLGLRMYAYTYFAPETVVRARRDVLARFLSASAKGWQYAAQHPEEAVDIVLRRTTGLDRSLELRAWKNEIPYMTSWITRDRGWGYMDPKVWSDLSDAFRSVDEIPRPVKPDEIMTNEIVELAKTPKV
jgi:NitT/TauT family transport system substrate-binding protein